MPFNTPNIFIGGTKAKAVEVNENFSAIKDELNKQASTITEVRDIAKDTNDFIKGDLKDELVDIVKSSRTRFCVNNGPLDSLGNANLLTYSGNIITTKTPFTYTDINGVSKTQEDSLNLLITKELGLQNIAIKEDKLETIGKICTQAKEPVDNCLIPESITTTDTQGYNFGAINGFISSLNSSANSTSLWLEILANGTQGLPVSNQVLFPNGESKRLHNYSVSCNWEGTQINRRCTAWKIYITKDSGVTWELVDTVTGQFPGTPVKGSILSFNLQTPVVCNGIKFEMTTGGQLEGGKLNISMGQIRFFGTGEGDIWVKRVEPLEAYRFESGVWEKYEGTPLGATTLQNGIVTGVKTFEYNWNGYNLNTTDGAKGFVATLGFLDWSKTAYNIANRTLFTAPTDGVIVGNIVSAVGVSSYLSFYDPKGKLINVLEYPWGVSYNIYDLFIPLEKGFSIIAEGTYGLYTCTMDRVIQNYLGFAPLKGAI